MIAFVSDRDGDYEIYLMTLPGSGGEGREIRQVSNNEADDIVPEWSPDGSQIAFSSDRDGNHEIYLIDVESALELREDYTPTRLTHDDAEDRQRDHQLDQGHALSAGACQHVFVQSLSGHAVTSTVRSWRTKNVQERKERDRLVTAILATAMV